MKSTQERSNECLPPKKRELAASTLASEERPLVVAPPPPPPPTSVGQQQAENLAWLASVAGGPMGASGSDVPQYKPLYSMSDTPSPSSSSLPTVYTSPVSQGALGGTIHYAQLPHHGLQFAIASPYAAPYAPVHGYIAPPPPLSPSPCHRPSDDTAEQHRAALLRASMPPPSTDAAPRTAPSPHHHHHQGAPHLQHPQHQHPALVPGLAQGGVLVHYTDVPQRKDERPRTLHNGKLLERNRRFDSAPSSKTAAGKPRDAPPTISSAYEARHLHLSSDYAAHSPAQMLPPNSHGELAPPRGNPEKGGILVGKPVSRGGSCVSSSSSCTPTFTFPPPLSVDALKSSHTVIQTTHNATESLSHGLPSAGVYAQSPVLGYVAEGGPQQQQQQPIGYHGSLAHHLLIPGPQPLIIPVSGVGVTTVDPSISFSSSSHFPSGLSYASAKAEAGEPAVVQAQLHLPVMPAPAAPSAAPPSLPPYFIKGSIIRLADGELKRVEELKTEDFIQSAEISSELKIDSSTVERIDRSHASTDFALVQFSVGEHRAQVSVEVLVEYPFFVFGQGWSSCCPDRTTQLLDLPCTKLSVGDVCISLTLKNLRNGSVKKAQSLELATPASLDTLQPRATPDATRNCSGGAPRLGEQENGFVQRGSRGVVGSTNAENGELGFGVRPSLGKGQGEAGAGRPPAGRKRRWSAPEGRKVERFEEEPPLTLPKPSFIPHELKVSIEGRSNIGK